MGYFDGRFNVEQWDSVNIYDSEQNFYVYGVHEADYWNSVDRKQKKEFKSTLGSVTVNLYENPDVYDYPDYDASLERRNWTSCFNHDTTIRFETDSYVQYAGFNLTWSLSEQSCTPEPIATCPESVGTVAEARSHFLSEIENLDTEGKDEKHTRIATIQLKKNWRLCEKAILVQHKQQNFKAVQEQKQAAREQKKIN